jgi:hypothetical protein
LPRLVQPSDWVRWLVPTVPTAAVASSNSGVPPMQARSAVVVEAVRMAELNGMATWGAAGDPEAVDQVFADAMFERLDTEPIAVATGE